MQFLLLQCLLSYSYTVWLHHRRRQGARYATWGVLLIETPCDVQVPAMAFVTQVKANFVRAVLALVAVAPDRVQPTGIAAHPAHMITAVTPLKQQNTSFLYLVYFGCWVSLKLITHIKNSRDSSSADKPKITICTWSVIAHA